MVLKNLRLFINPGYTDRLMNRFWRLAVYNRLPVDGTDSTIWAMLRDGAFVQIARGEDLSDIRRAYRPGDAERTHLWLVHTKPGWGGKGFLDISVEGWSWAIVPGSEPTELKRFVLDLMT